MGVVHALRTQLFFCFGLCCSGAGNDLKLFAKHHIAEGMQACVDYIENQNKWGSEKRIHELISILRSYGAHAKAFIPRLEKIAASIDGGEPNYPGHLSKQKAADLREAIKAIQASTEKPTLIPME